MDHLDKFPFVVKIEYIYHIHERTFDSRKYG